MEVHPSHTLKGWATSGRMLISIPEIPFPSPKSQDHRKNLIFKNNQKKNPPNSMIPKGAEAGQPIQVLHAMRTGVSTEAGRGPFAPSLGWTLRFWWRPQCRCGRPSLCRRLAGSGGGGVGGGVRCRALLERGKKVGRPLREQGGR